MNSAMRRLLYLVALIQVCIAKSGVRELKVTNITDKAAIACWKVKNEATKRIGTFKIVVTDEHGNVVHAETVRRKHWYKIKDLQNSTSYSVTVSAAGTSTTQTFKTGGGFYQTFIMPRPKKRIIRMGTITTDVRENSVVVRWDGDAVCGTNVKKCYVRYFKILCCVDGTKDCLMYSIIDGWRNSYTFNPVPPDASLKITMSACWEHGCSEPKSATFKTGPRRLVLETEKGLEGGDFEDEFDGHYDDDEELLEFDVSVESKWSDLIIVPYVPQWITRYRLTRNWQSGEPAELLKSGKGPASKWRTDSELWRGFTATKRCYNYTVILELITGSIVTSTSKTICVGPGSPASDQLKFWIFSTLFALIVVSIIGTAVFHEHRRELILKQDCRIKFELEY